ncbi:c-type cytochrome [Massilia dura]|uniref:C-type cytochrome n=1 Tax=Pseudoduganella dura TaxID=321982 RepID=A0A6I3X4Z8_9BURK|nr:c-type cytochrome [Pseudoduganella dura]MUI11794.1 c-type cytochrome [Pseudoduganella dura]GGX79175.1 cytochrome c [Pseudoduganella dura]
MPSPRHPTRTVFIAAFAFSLAAPAAASPPALPASPAPPVPLVPPDTLAQRVAPCVACHQPQGRNDAFFPRIAGKPEGYLYNQLLNFRDGRRQYPMMTYMVGHLPEPYLREIAQFFASQHPPHRSSATGPARVEATAQMLERGRVLVRQGDAARGIPACIACHGQALAGVAPAIPGLVGLPRDYINAQFGAWKNKVRRAQAPDCMADVASRLTGADVAAVSAWLASQGVDDAARPAAAPAAPLPLRCGGVPDHGGAR